MLVFFKIVNDCSWHSKSMVLDSWTVRKKLIFCSNKNKRFVKKKSGAVWMGGWMDVWEVEPF